MNTIRMFLFTVLCCLACCSSVIAQLPANDANKYQIIVVGSAGKSPATWFDEVPELAKLKQATAFTLLRPKPNAEARDGLFEARYQATLGTDLPIVAYLRPDGGVIYFADRHSLPSREKLYEEIKAAHLRAKAAVPAVSGTILEDGKYYSWRFLAPDLSMNANSAAPLEESSCPDGSCDTPLDSSPAPRFPNLHPFKNPLDGGNKIHPIDRIVSGWFSNSITSGIFLVFSVVCLMVIVLFAVLIFGAMIVVVRWVVK